MHLAGYEIQEVIYAVDDTVVARARSERGERVVLKYQDSDRPSPDLLARWQHEHAVLRSIDSEWVVKAHGLRQVEHSLILVLEDFASTNLAQLIARQPLDLSERLGLAWQLASAVSAVHAHGLIHGDISPKNVLVDVATMRLKLCDFGLSSRLDREQKVLQEAARLRGTLEYMSPEQTGRTNLDVDYRSDLYSLGVTLYELMGGRKPFQSSDPMTLLHAQIAVMPPALHEVDPNVPEAVTGLVHKLLSKQPDDRYQSSFGLLADLKRCVQQWQRSRRIEPFLLATSDVPERFCVSQRLYGRDAECATILAAFERASQGRAGLLLVSGYSGIGKTALVGELHRPVIARRGYFLRGKCDQYSRNQPYSVLIQAFAQLLRQLAVEGEERRAYWKAKLQDALGDNAGAITAILPVLTEIIGEPPPLPALPAAETENRFHIAFSQFVNALASRSHPLLVFLDDLQWADAPTLRLLEHLVREEAERCVLVVGAYRDNEVDAQHPLQATIEAIERRQGAIERLRLGNLAPADVRRLIADTLHCEEDAVATLADLCVEKTQGNPFFLGQLLRSLHEHGEIRYERADGEWNWDIEHIRRRGITDNVVELMLQKLRTLEPETQALLAMAAHLGDSFDLRQLIAVAERDAAGTAAALWPALQAGLVLPLNEHYKFEGHPGQLQARFRFQHDRVQQAAYDLTAPAERQALQLRCARLLVAGSSEAELEERLFNVLHSYNCAAALVTDPAERARLLALNLRGGMRAKAASALAAAVPLLRQAKALLADDAWATQPEQVLLLFRELAEAEYLAGHFEQAEALYPEGIAAAADPLARVTLLLVQADQYHIQGRFADAFPVLRSALDLLGAPFPATEAEAGALFPGEFAGSERLLAGRTPEELLGAAEMTDPARLLEMRAYFGIAYATYQIGSFGAYVLNACRMVRTTLEHGLCDLSSVAHVTFTTAMSAMKLPYPRCFAQGKLAMRLADEREDRYFRLSVYQYFSAFYQHWGEPMQEALPFLDKGVEMGQSGINPLAAGYCVLLRATNKFIQGEALDNLHLECERGLKFLQQSHQVNTEQMLLYGILLPLLALRGQTFSPTSFDTTTVRASEFFGEDYSKPSIPLAFHIASAARHAYLMGDAETWRRCADNLAVVGQCLPDGPSLVEASFYVALGLLKPEFTGEATPAADLAAARAHVENFRTWAEGCPANFLHKALLLEAELARATNADAQAMDLYAKAIDAAAHAGFTACEALANELYARFWLARSQRQLSSNFIRDAWYHFRRWGAEVKCRQLEQQWPEVSFRALERKHAGSVSTSQSLSYRSISEHGGGLLDLHSLFKTTQFLAKEIQLESLLPKMLAVLLENAGAEHGAIILVDEDELIVEAAGGLADGKHFDCQLISRPLAELCAGDRPALPTAIIEYVQLTRTTLLLDNPAADARFGQNPYVRQRHPKSVLCLPVHTQGKLVALVYLENNLMESAFTARHQHTLELLSSQAAISLVNARLYEHLERKVQQRTEELRQMSMRDGLTGIANRRSFDERLAVELRRGLRTQAPLSLLMMDIDHFKQYNDHCGHFQGDDCIKAVAATLAGVVSRASDLVARYGGEEFAILLPETDAEAAAAVAESCLRAVAALAIPHESSPIGPIVSVSIGACTIAVDPDASPATLITRADQALYQAKREGRNRVCLFTPAEPSQAA